MRGASGSTPRSGGYALVELAVAMLVLMISIGAISTSLFSTKSLSRSNEERTVALDAALSVLEAIRAEEPGEVFVRYNQIVGDEPVGGSSPGRYFNVPGLSVRPGDPDGFVGEVQFPGDGFVLREDVFDVELGMPRDLNSDGVQDANDHSLDYNVLPTRVLIEWVGATGVQKVELFSMIGRL